MIRQLRNFKVTTRIMLLAFMLVIMKVSILCYLLFQLDVIDQRSLLQQDNVSEQNQWLARQADLTAAQTDTQLLIQQAQRVQKSYSDMLFWYFDGTITQYYESLNKADQSAQLLEQQLTELALDPQAAPILSTVLKDLKDYREIMQSATLNYQQGRDSLASAEISDAHLIVESINGQLLDITELFQTQLKNANNEVELGLDKTLQLSALVEQSSIESSQQTTEINQAVMLILVFTVPLSIAIAVIIIVSITRPLKEMREQLLAIASNSDLTQSLSTAGRDEISDMSQATQSVLIKLRDMLTEVFAMTNQFKSTAMNSYQASQETHQKSTEQQMQSEGIASAAAELGASAEDISRTTGESLQLVTAVSDAAITGQQDVQETARAIEQLSVQFEQVETVVSGLAERSSSIEVVLDVIQDIAEKTNLLALNAAIEAARAGDQGRGFAVVADEVRILAQRTSQSTKEIQQMVETLQQHSEEATNSLETNRLQVVNGVQLSKQAEQSLNRIQQEMKALTEMNQSVAVITSEQQQAVTSVDESVQRVRQMACDVESHAADSQSANKQLNSMAEQLQTQLLSFRY